MSDLRLPRINRWIGSGRITNDIELRYTAKGTPVINFTLAVDRPVKDATGQWKNETSFIECTAWDKWAEKLNTDAHKGSATIVEGHIEVKSYVDSNQQNRKSFNIIVDYLQLLDKTEQTEEQPAESKPQQQAEVVNDDVPF